MNDLNGCLLASITEQEVEILSQYPTAAVQYAIRKLSQRGERKPFAYLMGIVKSYISQGKSYKKIQPVASREGTEQMISDRKREFVEWCMHMPIDKAIPMLRAREFEEYREGESFNPYLSFLYYTQRRQLCIDYPILRETNPRDCAAFIKDIDDKG